MMRSRKVHLVLIALSVLTILAVTSTAGLRTIESRAREDIERALRVALNTTHQALLSWSDGQRATARVWAQNAEVGRAVKELLALPRDTSALGLAKAPAQQELRHLLAPVLAENRFEGFFLISLDGRNIGSTRDENLGATNLLLTQRDSFLEQAGRGLSALSLPVLSDVPLQDKDGRWVQHRATMFSAAPVLDAQGDAIAVLAFRINPYDVYVPLLRRGRFGLSAETYAVGADGRLLSESAFDDQLRAANLLAPGQSSPLNIRIADPGRSLLEGPDDGVGRAAWPLTEMALSIASGESGANLEGYRDYRGILVAGAWLWSPELGMGLATEIEWEEYQAPVRLMWLQNLALGGIAALLLLGVLVLFAYVQRAATERELRFRELIEGSILGIAIMDDMTRGSFVNSALATTFGYVDSAALLRVPSLGDLCERGEEEKVMLHLEALTQGRATEETALELSCRRADGQKITIQTFFREVTWGGQKKFQVTVLDVTGERRLQDQLRQSQKMEAVGQLAGGVAHDFNNMLQIITGYTELAMQSRENHDAGVRHLKKVQQAAEGASALTRQLLAFSRKQVLKPKALKLNDHYTNLLKMLRRLIGEDIELELHLAEEIPLVKADPGMIDQVLMNLCVNARDAMPEGGRLIIETKIVELTLDFVHHHGWGAPGRYVLTQVSDNGSGMAKEVRDHIFEPFFTTKESGKGTGLGLSTVYGIVQQHGGMIDVYSEVGVGTTFKVYLPVNEQALQDVVPATAREAAGGHETLLVAEDEPAVLELVVHILESRGYTVHSAKDGHEALEKYVQHMDEIQLVLVDVIMPKMSGRKLFDRLRRINSEVPVVFSTGYTANMIDGHFLDQHGLRLVQKPYAPSELLRTVREVLDHQAPTPGA